MTKMNRRDYLIRMGAGAGAIVSGSGLNLFAQEKKLTCKELLSRASGQRASPGGILRWPTTETKPSKDAFVTVIFWGLMGFCYNTEYDAQPCCEVGFHRHPGHNFTIWLYKISGDKCEKLPLKLPPNRIEEMTMKVMGLGTPLQVYQEKDVEDFDRIKGDEADFRWLPDLDSADFYPEGYSKNKSYKTRLYLGHGTLYTRLKTNSTFQLVDAKKNLPIRNFGHVAMYMAAAIDVAGPNDSVVFQIDDEPACEPLKKASGVRYELVFRNECDSCDFTCNDPDEVKRNDFHFNRKVVKVPSSRTKYSLKVKAPKSATMPDFCYDHVKIALTDEAPCAGAGYGQSPEFPS